MKTTIRKNVFETNSSSVHAFVVFEDRETESKWTDTNQHYFLDARYVDWISCHEIDDLDEYDFYRLTLVGPEDIVEVESPEWETVLEEIDATNREMGDGTRYEYELSDVQYAEWNHVVPFGWFHGEPDSSYCSKEGCWFDDVRIMSLDKDDYGRQVYTIVCDE